METNAKRAWAINAMLLVVLALAAALKLGAGRAEAAGSGLSTDAVMVNVGDADEKLVVVNTSEKKIMLYKMEGIGQFRLLAARTYEFDQQFTDTSTWDEIEKKGGITAVRAAELYTEAQAAKKPK